MTHNLYRITGRAPASVIFRHGDEISANYVRDGIKGHLAFTTRYLECGFDVPVPGDMSVVIEAEAETIEEAITWITVGRELASIISLCTNAAISPFEGELVYDVTPGKTERQHFQRFTPADKGTFSSRVVPMDATVAVLSAIAGSEHRDRLLRAISQYNEALSRWALGNELLVVSHLWMGIEAIKKVSLRRHLKARGITKEELGAEWGFDPKRYMKLDQFLDAEARLRLTFKGDNLHHKLAREVSDSFEHGLENGGRLFARARDTLMPTAAYLRRAILEAAGVADEHQKAMLSAPYDRPRGPGGLEQYFRTTLVGESDQLAAEGYPHPMWEWKHTIKEVTLDRDQWRFSFKPDHTITARIGEDVKMVGGTLEVWDGGFFTPESAAECVAPITNSTPDASCSDDPRGE